MTVDAPSTNRSNDSTAAFSTRNQCRKRTSFQEGETSTGRAVNHEASSSYRREYQRLSTLSAWLTRHSVSRSITSRVSKENALQWDVKGVSGSALHASPHSAKGRTTID